MKEFLKESSKMLNTVDKVPFVTACNISPMPKDVKYIDKPFDIISILSTSKKILANAKHAFIRKENVCWIVINVQQ